MFLLWWLNSTTGSSLWIFYFHYCRSSLQCAKENGITNIGEEDDDCYDENYNYIGKGPVGHYELLGLVSNVAKRLQQEAFIEKKFGRKLPIIIHGLEYAWFDIEATQNANINGEADVFLKAMKELGMC